MSRRLIASAALAAVVLLGGSPARALLQQTAPAVAAATAPASTAPAGDAQAVEVVVVETTGMVGVSTDGKSWKMAAVGMVVGQGAQFKTGSKSSVTCQIPPDQTFKLESYSTLRVAEALRRGLKATTQLDLKYGAASLGIQKAGIEHASTIRTPSSTLAVRGTVVRAVDQLPFPPTAESFTGRAAYRTLQRETRLGGSGYAKVSSAQGSAADTALSQSVVDPAAARARSNSEARYVADQVSRGATLSFDDRVGIPVLRGGAGPTSDEALAASLPGRLSFALRWTGNADLNFVVDNQAGNQLNIILGGFKAEELLYPGFGLNTSQSGGLIPFDHRGGPKGGQEIAYWQGTFPTGVYGVGVLHASGATTDFKVNAFLDGQPLTIFGVDAESNATKTRTLRGTIGSGSPGEAGIIFVPNNPVFESIATDIDTATQAAVTQALARVNKPATAKPVQATGVASSVPAFAKPSAAKMAAGRQDGKPAFARPK